MLPTNQVPETGHECDRLLGVNIPGFAPQQVIENAFLALTASSQTVNPLGQLIKVRRVSLSQSRDFLSQRAKADHQILQATNAFFMVISRLSTGHGLQTRVGV